MAAQGQQDAAVMVGAPHVWAGALAGLVLGVVGEWAVLDALPRALVVLGIDCNGAAQTHTEPL